MLNKTDKGRAELLPGQRTLGQRERAVLLMADGKKSLNELYGLFEGQGRTIVQALLAQGFLAPETRDPAALAPPPGAPEHRSRAHQRPAPAPHTSARLEPPGAPSVSADTFSGPRSLASARMFLFDLSERSFAAADRAQADRFREALREAKEAPQMLRVARALLTEIERRAGPERADAISERLAKLLPEWVMHAP